MDQASTSIPGTSARLYRTIPEQIADSIGAAIMDGEMPEGERVLEEELAARYGVSRGSVREAIGLLERRGLLRSVPRRGTYVAGQSLDAIADMFNMRAVLIALAGRYVARRRDPAAISELRSCAAALDALACQEDAPPLDMARQAADSGEIIIRHCGAECLCRMLSEHAAGSGWSMIWRRRVLDFQTAARRRAYAAQFRSVVELIAEADDRAAEQRLRQMMFDCRDVVLQAIAAQRGGTVDALHAMTDGREDADAGAA